MSLVRNIRFSFASTRSRKFHSSTQLLFPEKKRAFLRAFERTFQSQRVGLQLKNFQRRQFSNEVTTGGNKLQDGLNMLKRATVEGFIGILSFGIPATLLPHILPRVQRALENYGNFSHQEAFDLMQLYTADVLLTVASLIWLGISSSRKGQDSRKLLRKWSIPGAILVFTPLMYALNCIIMALSVNNEFRQSEEPFLIKVAIRSEFIQCVSPVVLAPMAEELYFRYLWFGRMFAIGGPNIAYHASSLLFGAAHASSDASKVASCIAAGYVLCGVYHTTGRLIAPILFHIFNNAIQMFPFMLLNPTLMEPENSLEESVELFWHIDAMGTSNIKKILSSTNKLGLSVLDNSLVEDTFEMTREFRDQTNALFDQLVDNEPGEVDKKDHEHLPFDVVLALLNYDKDFADLLSHGAGNLCREIIHAHMERLQTGDDTKFNELIQSCADWKNFTHSISDSPSNSSSSTSSSSSSSSSPPSPSPPSSSPSTPSIVQPDRSLNIELTFDADFSIPEGLHATLTESVAGYAVLFGSQFLKVFLNLSDKEKVSIHTVISRQQFHQLICHLAVIQNDGCRKLFQDHDIPLPSKSIQWPQQVKAIIKAVREKMPR